VIAAVAGPEFDRPGSNERLGMGKTLSLCLTASKDLISLPQVTVWVDFLHACLNLYKRRNHCPYILRDEQGSSIAKNLVVELQQPPTGEVSRMSPAVVRECGEHFGGNEQVAVPALPQ
jgi:hypothetical protein